MHADHVRRRDWHSISRIPEVQARYVEMRLAGESHNMAEMLATRKFPGLNTDTTFNEGRCNGNQFENTPGQGDYYKSIAEKHGVSVTGKHYCAALAEFPGDPTAWVSSRGDVLRVAAEKGFRVSGAVDYDPGEREPIADVEIADDIVESAVDDVMAKDGGERRDDVRERVYNQLSGRVDNGDLCVSDPTEDW